MELTSLAPYTLLLARHSASEITRTSTPSSRGLGSSAASEVVPKPVTRATEPGAGECEAGGRHTGVMPLPGHKDKKTFLKYATYTFPLEHNTQN